LHRGFSGAAALAAAALAGTFDDIGLKSRPAHVSTPNTTAGRCCPLGYRYRPEVFRGLDPVTADTAYVVGGLYGNGEALRTLLAMKAAEEARGRRVTLIFNGDFNWFNVDEQSFADINATVLEHLALRGNVETELLGADAEAGCGCAYPDYVGADTVARSNAIMTRLQAAAADQRALAERVSGLPMQLSLRVGELAIGVVHGDPESLAGWGLAVECMEPLDTALRAQLSCRGEDITSAAQVAEWLRRAGVRIFACSHTCLPFAQDLEVDGRRCLIINNGAAGMPNFAGTRHGVVTRISVGGPGPFEALYGTTVDGVSFEALAVRYDHERWMAQFTTNWPPGSPAHASYARRLLDGPTYVLSSALRLSDAPALKRFSS
jgi:hypothetical protein